MIGTGLGFVLAKRQFRAKELCDALLTLPMVLPPTVTGYYLMLLLGRHGLLGRYTKCASPLSRRFKARHSAPKVEIPRATGASGTVWLRVPSSRPRSKNHRFWEEFRHQRGPEDFPLTRQGPTGEYLPIRNYRRAWARVLKRAGIEQHLLVHDLRRTAITRFEMKGVQRKTAMSITGHQTESAYTRYSIANLAEVASLPSQ